MSETTRGEYFVMRVFFGNSIVNEKHGREWNEQRWKCIIRCFDIKHSSNKTTQIQEINHTVICTWNIVNTVTLLFSPWVYSFIWYKIQCQRTRLPENRHKYHRIHYLQCSKEYLTPEKSIGGGNIQSQTSNHTTWPIFNQSQNSWKFRRGSHNPPIVADSSGQGESTLLAMLLRAALTADTVACSRIGERSAIRWCTWETVFSVLGIILNSIIPNLIILLVYHSIV
jgi:hypothetical protein